VRTHLWAVLLAAWSRAVLAQSDPAFEVHAQTTYIRQQKPAFDAPYSGTNSLLPQREKGYTFTATIFLAARAGDTEFYFNPEFVSGVPLSDLHGLGGMTNGENQRGTGSEIRGYRARAFVRHTWNVGGAFEEQASDQNQVKTRHAAERIVLTAGNVSVLDVFDVMDYSRDARTQFFNWTSLTYGAWDFPADARGYTWGVALDYISPRWQARVGRFLVPLESNGLKLDHNWRQHYGDVAEIEVPYTLAGRSAIARALVFRNRLNAGGYDDAIAAASPPDVSLVRRTQTKKGFGLSTQVELTEAVGAYLRAGWSDGRTEEFMFTEVDRSLAIGTLLKGGAWTRPNDKLGFAAYVNGLSRPHRDYLAKGGLGFFIGDGQLNYSTERILETFYSFGLTKALSVSVDYQRIANPGYNRDRGPVDVFALRLHAEF
jgi:hypothetical protein